MIGKTEGTDVRTRTSGIADGRLKTELPRDRPACGLPPRLARAGCKNKPNGAEPIVQNKANPGGAGWVGAQGRGRQCAKQTQFATTARGMRPEGRGAIAPNKPNCPKRGTEALSGSRPAGIRGPVVQTKPISVCASGEANILQTMTYDEFCTQTASAKQSQFEDGQVRVRAAKPACTAGGASCTTKANLVQRRVWTRAGRIHPRRGAARARLVWFLLDLAPAVVYKCRFIFSIGLALGEVKPGR